jgi:hypothetical protein
VVWGWAEDDEEEEEEASFDCGAPPCFPPAPLPRRARTSAVAVSQITTDPDSAPRATSCAAPDDAAAAGGHHDGFAE